MAAHKPLEDPAVRVYGKNHANVMKGNSCLSVFFFKEPLHRCRKAYKSIGVSRKIENEAADNVRTDPPNIKRQEMFTKLCTRIFVNHCDLSEKVHWTSVRWSRGLNVSRGSCPSWHKPLIWHWVTADVSVGRKDSDRLVCQRWWIILMRYWLL